MGADADEADAAPGVDQEDAGAGDVPGLEVDAYVDAIAADGGAIRISQEREWQRQALREAPDAFRRLTIHTNDTDVAPFPFLQLARELRQISPAVGSPGVAEEYQQLPLAAGRNVAELFGIRSQRQGESRRGVSEPERFRALGTRHGRTFVGFWTSDANLSIAMPRAGGRRDSGDDVATSKDDERDGRRHQRGGAQDQGVAPDEVSGPQLVHRVPVAKDADLLQPLQT